MKREKQNKNTFGNFMARNQVSKKKRVISLVILLFVFAGGIWVVIENKKSEKQLIEQAQVAAPTSILPGWWLRDFFGASICDDDACKETADPDKDGLTNAQEYFYSSDPKNPDTNGNGMTDGEMVAKGFDPSRPGKLSLDRELTDEEIFNESLLYDDDMKNIINDLVDPNKVKLPAVEISQINILYENSEQNLSAYLQEVNNIVTQYFSEDFETSIAESLSSNNYTKIEQLKTASKMTLIEMRKMTVPSDAVVLHQYYMAMYQLLPDVLSVPDESALRDETSVAGNSWYDKTQALSVLMYKVDAENRKLSEKYQ